MTWKMFRKDGADDLEDEEGCVRMTWKMFRKDVCR